MTDGTGVEVMRINRRFEKAYGGGVYLGMEVSSNLPLLLKTPVVWHYEPHLRQSEATRNGK